MQKKRFSISMILYTIVAIFIMLTLPTGWLYDLKAGTGTEQGQKTTQNVQQIYTQQDISYFFDTNTPVTITGNDLVACPLARLRDVEQKGIHYQRVRHTTRTVYISEYITTHYPMKYWEKILQNIIAGGTYNRYYLIQLSDNYWLCVYFDDYLALIKSKHYPTGYIRHTTTTERTMLNKMAQHYNVDTVYILDMYRYGKVNSVFDIILRFIVLVVVLVIIITIQDLFKKQKTS
ncbi:hypothetical protein [Clostridium sp. MD294]|uniref:hypothetical protein n=1 Tax=Clostridium sp. MD294 TaxID=97138 RepID=UPI0002C93CE5|nr:hypothetical protein [Clostridium sp. MD294]NDO46241.1 hypothetical protein [Clostridium sp. MD294]USF30090.1 hypothetical protein C820_001531 [Clostridium sp. MD294]